MKTLKSFGLLAGALALILGTFSSCEKEETVIVEDGFYKIGRAHV